MLIATYRRPQVSETLASLARQEDLEGVRISVVVVDNDSTPSAEAVVREAAKRTGLRLRYFHVAGANISIARNAALEASGAEWLAFLDDDEVAEPGWLSGLLRAAADSGADASFGPVEAIYPSTAPRWMTRLDLHSNRPVLRGGRLLTGHTCNGLVRWRGTAWADLRFEEALGRSGGEDTVFFFEAARLGMRMVSAPDAVVREVVAPDRLTFRWLARRRFRMGQSHARMAATRLARAGLLASAGAKGLYCGLRAAVGAFRVERRNYWALRGALHMGVMAGALRVRQPVLYGGAE